MDTIISEQTRRRVGVQRLLQGDSPSRICRDLDRSRPWLYKWWDDYQHDPNTDFSDHSRAPQTSPQQTSTEMERAIVAIRQAREAGDTPQTQFGLIGSPTIRFELKRLGYKDLPSVSTIQRILAAHGLTHPLGVSEETAAYPWPLA